ncbi:alpha/beta fold hydrolase [Micromonospora echinofusca]|uniref:thioesterase II family protein n=1 Tax=Micromonospora echinofusca TaxID=47858 RepID=UPI000CAA9DF4|nr:alpha/beta fold hydrolase [Micromonospora sp. MSM11]MCL7460825.1 alpha/beta fold hydrolase [Micromonospora sp. MSM11]
MTDTELWIRRFHPADEAATRLLCLPHAGGSASYFLAAAKALAPEVDVLAVQYPGRQDRWREPGLTSVHEIADQLAAALPPLLDRPVTIFGHSLGATIGFEVARRLGLRGVVPTALFASGRRAPHRRKVERVHLRDDAGLIAEVRALAGTDDALLDDEDVVRMVLPAIRSDYTAAETYEYRPGPRLDCPIVALIGDCDPRVTVDEAQAWEEHTGGGFELVVHPGGHFYLNDKMPDVLRRIRTHTRALNPAPPGGAAFAHAVQPG